MADKSTRHDPITATEFNKAFQALWRIGGGRKAFKRLGLAVSGGVDSMALAYLWKQFRQNKPGYVPYIRGFVIDHGLRPGSAEEAHLVAKRLEPLLGQPAQVITLSWSKYGGPENVTAVETAARKLRFQALGQAARSHGIQCLLLGHHANDMAETALFRMMNGAQSFGLLGFKSLVNVPECHGKFGIHTSGSFKKLASHETMRHYVGGPEEGGIKVGRPLLEFPKSRLIATCEKAGIEWVEDGTNRDTRLTPRNAIRAMIQSDVLPVALRSTSIHTLLKDIQNTNEIRQSITRRLYAATKVDSLDLRSGVIHLYLPSSSVVNDLIQEFTDQNLVFEAFTALLHSFGECVSPAEALKSAAFRPISEILFEELITGQRTSTDSHRCVSELIIERIPSLSIAGTRHIGLRLHRAPSQRTQRGQGGKQHLMIPPTSLSSKTQSLSGPTRHHQWQLWDGRWWMSIINRSPVPLRVEALDQDKIGAFKTTIDGYKWSAYSGPLSEAAPGPSRWTIPSIVCDEPPPEESMIRPRTRYWKDYKSQKPVEVPFEITKYHAADVSTQDLVTGSTSISSSIPASSLDPSLFTSENNLSRSPQSAHRVARVPKVLRGITDAAKYPEYAGPFIVAIPTMDIFLNSYWVDKLDFDIRYKNVPLQDMDYITRYRLEKPATVNGVAVDRIVPTIKNEAENVSAEM